MRQGEKTKVFFVVLILGLLLITFSGCGQLRLAPDEKQKQNAYLHQKTLAAAANQARQEEASTQLKSLTDRAERQGEIFLAHYGMPESLPATGTMADLLSENNSLITESAYNSAILRPDTWQVADNVLELGIGLAGLLGGVWGTKAAALLVAARQKSKALEEVIVGNEFFKQQNPEVSSQFKEAQKSQSVETRSLVATIKQKV